MKEREKERVKKPDEAAADEAAMVADYGQSKQWHHSRFLGLQSGKYFLCETAFFLWVWIVKKKILGVGLHK